MFNRGVEKGSRPETGENPLIGILLTVILARELKRRKWA